MELKEILDIERKRIFSNPMPINTYICHRLSGIIHDMKKNNAFV